MFLLLVVAPIVELVVGIVDANVVLLVVAGLTVVGMLLCGGIDYYEDLYCTIFKKPYKLKSTHPSPYERWTAATAEFEQELNIDQLLAERPVSMKIEKVWDDRELGVVYEDPVEILSSPFSSAGRLSDLEK